MVEVTESTVSELKRIAQKKDKDEEAVNEKFKEKYKEVKERTTGLPEEKVESLALRQFRTETMATNRVPTTEVTMATIGGDVRNTSNGDMFFGTALVDEKPEEDNGSYSLGSVRIFDSDFANRVYEAFDQVGNIVSGNFSVSEGDIGGHVEVSDSDNTDFDVVRPDDRSGVLQDIRDMVPETSIAEISDTLSAKTRNDDGDMFTVSSDLYRIEADIIDGYKNPDTGVGIYTLRDDTVFDEEDVVESPVVDEEALQENENITPGLTCFFDVNKMEWGTSSIVEFFGTINKDEDGIIQMSADGAVPIMPNEDGFDGYTDSEEEQSDDPSQGVVEPSNVDRQTI